MSWFGFLRKKQKNKKYIIKDDSKTHTVTELVKIIKTNKGYTSSPYSKKYIKPDSTQHEYIPIKTTFSNEPVPLAKPKEEENIHARVPDLGRRASDRRLGQPGPLVRSGPDQRRVRRHLALPLGPGRWRIRCGRLLPVRHRAGRTGRRAPARTRYLTHAGVPLGTRALG